MKHTMLLCMALLILGCQNSTEKKDTNDFTVEANMQTNEADFTAVLKKHLDAVTNKDLETLESTLSPNGNMQLILPKTEITTTAEAFMDYHREWFAAPIEWTFETKVLNTNIGERLGMAVVEIVYREPLRDGKPYSNRMIVSYDLEKIDGKWYFIKDHASSVEKSTD
ncbi:YybH family protein [Lacinutrix chionoecetis]